MQAPRAAAPVKTVVAEILRAPVRKVDGAAANRRRRAVAGRGKEIQPTVGRGRRQGERAGLTSADLQYVVGIGRLDLIPGPATRGADEGQSGGQAVVVRCPVIVHRACFKPRERTATKGLRKA